MNWNPQALLDAAEHLTGFVIVMLALSVLWGLTALMGRIVALLEKRKAAATATASLVSGIGAPDDASADAVPEEDLVIIASAVAALVDGPHRVVSVEPRPSSWGQQGRREIHASHRIR
jgi:Na+-transporting methylmalonyl-CoA/oxaloacetate decarboxylase gamma subunit